MIISTDTVFYKHHKVLVECDFKVSPKCRGQYLKLYKNVLKGRSNNDGKDRCQYCFNSLTKTGENNFNFKYPKDEKFFEIIDSELKAYLLGWIAGDGSIKKDTITLEIHKDDVAVLELFKNYICPTSQFFHHSDPVRGANTICWKIHSVKMINDVLYWLGLEKTGKKSDKIKMPQISTNLQWVFLRGLFDSDGSVTDPYGNSTNPLCNICSISKDMIEDIKKLCDYSNVKYYNNNGRPQLMFGQKNANDFMDKIYENSTYKLSRKFDKYQIWKTWIPLFGTSVKPRKIRTYYPPISEEHKEKIRISNRKRKGKKYERTSILCN